MSQQLVKKDSDGRYSNVMPKSWIEAIKDKNTGQTLVEILQGFNMYFLPYNGNTSSTRCLVPTMLRKKGLWITYVKYDGNVYTEWYAASDIDDKSWGDSSNWRIGNNTLVGDITISANGNWVINGTESEFKAVGEKGNTPLIRVANNRLQVSYDLGDTYKNVTENPVYTQFRNYNNKIQVSTDLGATWTDASDEIAAYFRWQATTDDTQANNVGRLQISRDNKTWTNLSNNIVNNLHISKYIGANELLPTSGIAEGTIYAKGPTYAVEDTSNSNPIYRLWVYAWKNNILAWQDNGEFTSIAAGIVQETGNNENVVMSQKATTDKFTELDSNISELEECITGNTEDSNNLLRPNIEFKKEGADAEFIGFTIKVTATNEGTFKSIQIPIDTNGKQTITISNKNYSGTGSGLIRIASSDDGVTKKDWLGFVPSNGFKTFYVSGLEYILIYLYAVYEDNVGIGNYIIYDSIQVEEGTQPTEYKGFKILKDIVARENINFIENRVQTIQDILIADRVKSVDLGYCRKDGIRVEYTYPLNFNIANGSLIVSSDNTWAAVRYIDADGNRIYDSEWIQKPSTFNFSTEGYKVSKISILVRNSSNIDLPLEEIIDRISLSFDVFTHTQEQLDNFTTKTQEQIDNITIKTIGVGERIYKGEKINLKDIHTCDMKLWKEFGYEEDKQWRENQSMNIYNDIVFLFLNGGKVHCLSYKTKDYISSFQIESNANHANNAVWLYKYASDDIYPLIAVSRCFDAHQECLIYRIANDLTNAELVSTINCTNDGSYDSSFVFDNNGYIYKLTYTKGNYDSGDANGNRIRIMGWWMPDLASTITLNSNDAVIDITLPFTTIQGAQIHNGLLYLANVAGYGKKVGTNGIWVIDINSARVLSQIQRTTGEMEGICIYNNHIYTSQRSSSISEVPNLKIYEWSF